MVTAAFIGLVAYRIARNQDRAQFNPARPQFYGVWANFFIPNNKETVDMNSNLRIIRN